MKSLKKIAAGNLVAILIYSIAIRAASGTARDATMTTLVFCALAVTAHVAICLYITIIKYVDKDKESGRAWLLSSGIVLLVGFSACLGSAAL